jgi:L-ascorbate metabolism protein UlaG (beta-lactamase superfamily)
MKPARNGRAKILRHESIRNEGECHMVEVIWHGHACFELRGAEATVVLDPFTGLGIPEPKATADVVLCSHSHRDHNHSGPVLKEGGTVVEGFVGSRAVAGISVTGVATFHDAEGGSQRGTNSIYVVHLDGLRFCHLGDLGHDLTQQQLREIGSIDVLLTPVGGGPTIGPDLASSIAERLDPKIVVPMHYNADIPGQGEWMSTRLHRVDDFLRSSGGPVERLDGHSFNITKESLPKERKIIVPTFT